MELQSFATLRFADLDVLGHVNSLRLAELVEDGRMQMLDQVPRSEESDFVLVSLHLDYKARATPGGKLRVVSRVETIGRSSIRLRHAVTEEGSAGTVIVEAEAVVVHVSRITKAAAPLSEDQRKALA
jgi:acyl-CoA thioester hydrolase